MEKVYQSEMQRTTSFTDLSPSEKRYERLVRDLKQELRELKNQAKTGTKSQESRILVSKELLHQLMRFVCGYDSAWDRHGKEFDFWLKKFAEEGDKDLESA